MDADVSITGIATEGDLKITIGTYGEYGSGPYVLAEGSFFQQTSITSLKGIISIVITGNSQ